MSSSIYSKVYLTILTTNPASPPAGEAVIFAKSDGLYVKTSAGVVSKAGNDPDIKEYRAILTGSNGALAAPTVRKNEFSAAIVWAYSAEGVYTGTLAGAFTGTSVQVTLGTATGGVIIGAVVTSADVITLSSFAVDGTTPADFIGTINVQVINE